MRETFCLCDSDRDGFIFKKELIEFPKLAGGDKEQTGEESKQKIAAMMAIFDQDAKLSGDFRHDGVKKTLVLHSIHFGNFKGNKSPPRYVYNCGLVARADYTLSQLSLYGHITSFPSIN